MSQLSDGSAFDFNKPADSAVFGLDSDLPSSSPPVYSRTSSRHTRSPSAEEPFRRVHIDWRGHFQLASSQAETSELGQTDGGAPTSTVRGESEEREGISLEEAQGMIFGDDELPSEDEDDDGDFTNAVAGVSRMQGQTAVDKTVAILALIRATANFSFPQLLTTLLTSTDSRLHATQNQFPKHLPNVMLSWLKKFTVKQVAPRKLVDEFAINRVSEIVAREAAFATDQSHYLPSGDEGRKMADSLRVPAGVIGVDEIKDFSYDKLDRVYRTLMPVFQQICASVVGSVDSKMARVVITSVGLNARSQHTNLFQVVQGLLAFTSRVKRSFMEVQSQLYLSVSPRSTYRGLKSLSASCVALAAAVATSILYFRILLYDNFNWEVKVREEGGKGMTVSKNEVSATLIAVLSVDGDPPMVELAAEPAFVALEREVLTKELEDVLLDSADWIAFEQNSTTAVYNQLAKRFTSLDQRPYSTSNQVPLRPSKMFPLPTAPIDQATVGGNIRVLEHYASALLGIFNRPDCPTWKDWMFAVCGDRLTDVRVKAAITHRALDKDPSESLRRWAILPGLLHTQFTLQSIIHQTCWGNPSFPFDIISLGYIKTKFARQLATIDAKDFYPAAALSNQVLLAHFESAAIEQSGAGSVAAFEKVVREESSDELFERARVVAKEFMMRGPVVREVLEGNTDILYANAGQSMFYSWLGFELARSIKAGHADSFFRVIKAMIPMCAASGHHNYTSELLDLVTNYLFRWPKGIRNYLLHSLVVNVTGKPEAFKPSDLAQEHANKDIKVTYQSKGANQSSEWLQMVSPIVPVLRNLLERLQVETGAGGQGKHHSHVNTVAFVEKVRDAFLSSRVHHRNDSRTTTEQVVLDLLPLGETRLGYRSGWANYLMRQEVHLRRRGTAKKAGGTVESEIPFLNEDDTGREIPTGDDFVVITVEDSDEVTEDDDE
ncbi:hypothetical protein P7C70_g1624, partial [Phenoliferia sp. Uapishka_3]